jgi:uncharacterized spore protein YtfJ
MKMSGQQKALANNENSFIERLAHQLGITANAKFIYAEPVERDGVTVIPAARAVYGFGGGSGRKDSEKGSGGGGGVALTPVGYIEIKNGETRFRPARDPVIYLLLAAAAAPLLAFTVRRLTRMFLKGRTKGNGDAGTS